MASLLRFIISLIKLIIYHLLKLSVLRLSRKDRLACVVGVEEGIINSTMILTIVLEQRRASTFLC